MAAIVLGTALSASSGALGLGAIGSSVGYAFGSYLGNIVDNRLFSGKNKSSFLGSTRLNELFVQSSAYGQPISIIYGSNRIAENIIWSTDIEEHNEHITHSRRVGKGGGRKVSQTEMRYNYSVNLAISLGLGPIDEVIRVWADTKLLNLDNIQIRTYNGSNEQMPDPMIEAICGMDKTPAYRGMAYVVFEQLDLAPFGGRIPNFTFEVKKNDANSLNNVKQLENMLKSVVLIPSCGEFIYDTATQFKQGQVNISGNNFTHGKLIPINKHNVIYESDAELSIKQLLSSCKNLSNISITNSWFADSLDIATLTIEPRVEFKNMITYPNEWKVANFSRNNCREISKAIDGKPLFGGTISDNSLLSMIDMLNEKNIKATFYPLLQIDIEQKPWRGNITGNIENIEHFFDEYNKFVLHYADLLQGKIDSFIIGSELIGLTKITDGDGCFPAVTSLIKLAREVKKILGNEVIVTYAADWSEYHHTTGGWYNLDELWADYSIDVIGIDAYFPLTEFAKDCYDENKILQGWYSGHGYDYFTGENEQKEYCSSEYAWKNIRYFWENYHFQPNGQKSQWQPKSKSIWFTEFGFPSVDGASNQPNVFYDPESYDSGLPKGSSGIISFEAQRCAMGATLSYIEQNQDMITKAFAWCWDARPYPIFPDLHNVWRDTKLWEKGHWLNGKIGKAGLSAIIADLCDKAKIHPNQIDVSRLTATTDGLIISENVTTKEMIESLAKTYRFDIFNSAGKLNFVPRTADISYKIDVNDMLAKDETYPLEIIRNDHINIPSHVKVVYADRNADYQFSVEQAKLNVINNNHHETIYLPVVADSVFAKRVAEYYLRTNMMELVSFKFSLLRRHSHLALGDLIEIIDQENRYIARIMKLSLGINGEIEITAVQDDPALYDVINANYNNKASSAINLVVDPIFQFIPVVNLQGNLEFLMAAASKLESFRPVIIYDDHYNIISEIMNEATIGTLANNFDASSAFLLDEKNSINIVLNSGELEQKSTTQYAFIGSEIIGFQDLTMVAENHYLITKITRGINGKINIQKHYSGENFVLIDQSCKRINAVDLNNIKSLIAVHEGQELNNENSYPIGNGFTNLASGEILNCEMIEFIDYYAINLRIDNNFPNIISDLKSEDLSDVNVVLEIFSKKNELINNQIYNANATIKIPKNLLNDKDIITVFLSKSGFLPSNKISYQLGEANV